MKILKLYVGLKYAVAGTMCFLIASFLYATLYKATSEHRIEKTFEVLPDFNYSHEIKELKKDGKLFEALELARFVIRHPEMPGQIEARAFEREIESDLSSLWSKAKRATKGFITGSGVSIEEIMGGIASDMIIYGDLRDLVTQGYYKITGEESDPFIVVLSSVGILTQVAVADWVPAVLKVFRKTGALSQRLGEFVMVAAKESINEGKLDGTLKSLFENLTILTDRMSLGRTATILKHVNDPDDLASIAAVAKRNAEVAYFTIKNGGDDGILIIKHLGASEIGVSSLAQAARKGPAGIEMLKPGGEVYKILEKSRFCSRVIKNFYLERPQKLIEEFAKKSSKAITIIYVCLILFLVLGAFLFIEAGRKFYSMLRQS